MKTGIRLLAIAAIALSGLTLFADDLPLNLPDPDGKPGDASKPVKVYILAGQSNMVGMGNLSGAKPRYAGIYLSADSRAPLGPVYVGRNLYKIATHNIYAADSPNAVKAAVVSIYKSAFDATVDYGKIAAEEIFLVQFGKYSAKLPTIDGPHTVVVRGFLDVPDSGTYQLNAGFGDSSFNVAKLKGQEVYRKVIGGKVISSTVELKSGVLYPLEITYFKNGSPAFWLEQVGLRGKGDLETVTRLDKKFQNLVDDQGGYTVRNDVYYQEARIGFQGSPLSPTSNGKAIGPELGFGHVMGTFHDEQVLLIKTAMGNRALGWDYRPPSSGRTNAEGADKWEGLEYRLMVEGVRKTLDNIKDIVPGYQGQGYEIAGFAWWQGHKDGGIEGFGDAYEQNLVNLINDVRKEFKSPKMPAVVATVGFGGYRMNEKYLQILNAQMAVGDATKHPEFAGNVASVDTRDFWREVDDSPVSQDYHYNRNAETYLLVGDALGRAMVRLQGGEAAVRPKTSPYPAFQQQKTPKPVEVDEAAAKAARIAIRPIIIDGMLARYTSDAKTMAAVRNELSGERPQRVSQFLRGATHGLTEHYRAAEVHDYAWRRFGPDLDKVKWDYFSFDPKEQLPKDKGGRFRKVTYPNGMNDWSAVDFDADKAGWNKGQQPFGQLDGKLLPLKETCSSDFCGCGIAPRTLWDKEVLLVRTTIQIPPLKEGHRYRVVVGGSDHVNSGEGFAVYVNGKLLAQSTTGVPNRQGGQPRGGYVYNDLRKEFAGGKVTIAATSFLRYNHPRQGVVPPRGHLSLWLEEMKNPPLPTGQQE